VGAYEILKNCYRMMPENGKLLLVEMVIPLGNGPFFGKFLNLEMLLGGSGGSDAHRSDDIGSNFDIALGAMRAAGLKYVTMFEKREARLVKIE
jgi:hypothetical protein